MKREQRIKKYEIYNLNWIDYIFVWTTSMHNVYTYARVFP